LAKLLIARSHGDLVQIWADEGIRDTLVIALG
jgi:hypothetical protein